MAPTPTISLEQWRALVAVVDEGGYAAAAEGIHKSQSAVTYAVQQVEKLLGVKAFRLEGRKAVLTPAPSEVATLSIVRCSSRFAIVLAPLFTRPAVTCP